MLQSVPPCIDSCKDRRKELSVSAQWRGVLGIVAIATAIWRENKNVSQIFSTEWFKWGRQYLRIQRPTGYLPWGTAVLRADCPQIECLVTHFGHTLVFLVTNSNNCTSALQEQLAGKFDWKLKVSGVKILAITQQQHQCAAQHIVEA